MRIADWSRFQGYTKRGPAWIKLHTSLIDQPQFLALPLVARAVLPVLWITAARLTDDGSLPDDLALLAVLSHCPEQELRDSLKALRTAGFIECDESVAVVATPLSHQTERETEGEEKRIAAAPPSWSREACDVWIARYGGTAPGGRIGKALKPLVDRYGWPAVRVAWLSYLTQSDAEFASPQRFAATYGRWSGAAPPGPAGKAAAIQAGNRSVLEAFVKGGG